MIFVGDNVVECVGDMFDCVLLYIFNVFGDTFGDLFGDNFWRYVW